MQYEQCLKSSRGQILILARLRVIGILKFIKSKIWQLFKRVGVFVDESCHSNP